MREDLTTDAIYWLTDLIMGAAGNLTFGDAFSASLKLLMTIPSPSGQKFQIYTNQYDGPLVHSDRYTLYVCLLPSKNFGLMKITPKADRHGKAYNSAEIANINRVLADEANLLRTLRQASIDLDTQQRRLEQEPYFHHAFFPQLVDAFMSGDGRQIEILSYSDSIEKLTQLIAVSRIMKDGKNDLRIDVRSLVWILGKLLKVIHFAHTKGVTNGMVNASNVMIDPKQHYLVLLDWTKAKRIAYESVTSSDAQADLRRAAAMAITLVGGNPEKEVSLPYDRDVLSPAQLVRFEVFLKDLLMGDFPDAVTAHKKLYDMSDECWPPQLTSDGELKRVFYPFKTYNR